MKNQDFCTKLNIYDKILIVCSVRGLFTKTDNASIPSIFTKFCILNSERSHIKNSLSLYSLSWIVCLSDGQPINFVKMNEYFKGTHVRKIRSKFSHICLILIINAEFVT